MGYKDPAKQRAYQLEWITRRRTAWIAANGPCALCGSDSDLEVDHVDPLSKTVNPARLWSMAPARAAVELANCRVLCRDCHAAKSATECVRGERVGTSKLGAADVKEIRGSALSTRALAAAYEVHPTTISRLRRRETWAHVGDAA